MPATIEACKLDLFSDKADLEKRYPPVLVSRIIRIRDMYSYFMANPDSADRDLIRELMNRYDIQKSAAYSDLAIIKQLLPMLSQESRDFHRVRANEMLLETYKRAKKRNNIKGMVDAAVAYAKFNRVDLEDEKKLPFDLIVPQPYVATTDPSVLGINTNFSQDEIDALIAKYDKEDKDIQDIEYEELDGEEEELFGIDDDDDEENDDEEVKFARLL